MQGSQLGKFECRCSPFRWNLRLPVPPKNSERVTPVVPAGACTYLRTAPQGDKSKAENLQNTTLIVFSTGFPRQDMGGYSQGDCFDTGHHHD